MTWNFIVYLLPLEKSKRKKKENETVNFLNKKRHIGHYRCTSSLNKAAVE